MEIIWILQIRNQKKIHKREVVKIKIKDIEKEVILDDIYSSEAIDDMLDNDELDPFEAAFMKGYAEA